MSDSKNEQEEVVPSFVKMLFELFSDSKKESIDLKLGDKVVISDITDVTYLVPKGSPNTIGSNYEKHHDGLSSYFTEVPGTVTKVNVDFVYNCGHCSREHRHDIIIYYKEINKHFYANSNGVTLIP